MWLFIVCVWLAIAWEWFASGSPVVKVCVCTEPLASTFNVAGLDVDETTALFVPAVAINERGMLCAWSVFPKEVVAECLCHAETVPVLLSLGPAVVLSLGPPVLLSFGPAVVLLLGPSDVLLFGEPVTRPVVVAIEIL